MMESVYRKISRSSYLSDEIIMLDGVSGTGKTMICSIIAGFEGVQNPRFEYSIEYFCLAGLLKNIESDGVAALLNLVADWKYYDGYIGREINFRPRDLTGVFSNGNGLRYLGRLFSADGRYVENKIKENREKVFFVTHQLLSCYEFLMGAYGKRLRLIEMVRHPLYLFDHWLSYIEMHGSNPRDFTVWINEKGEDIPWFAEKFSDSYNKLTSAQKVVMSLEVLMEPVFHLAEGNDSDSIIFIPFEHFVLSPHKYMEKIESLIGSACKNGVSKRLKDQKVPRDRIFLGPVKSIYRRYGVRRTDRSITHIQYHEKLWEAFCERADNETVGRMSVLAEKYEKIFGLWF